MTVQEDEEVAVGGTAGCSGAGGAVREAARLGGMGEVGATADAGLRRVPKSAMQEPSDTAAPEGQIADI